MIIDDYVISEAKAALKASKAFIRSQYLSSGMIETHTQEEWEEYLRNKDFSAENKLLSTSEGRSKVAKAFARNWAVHNNLPYPSDWDDFISSPVEDEENDES